MTEQNTTENTAEVALEENKLIAERRSKLAKLRESSASNRPPCFHD